MLDIKDDAGATAVSYADAFLDGAVKKIDKTFGKDFAAQNPGLVSAYLAACASNLSTFISAALTATDLQSMLDDADIEDLFEDAPPKGKRS